MSDVGTQLEERFTERLHFPGVADAAGIERIKALLAFLCSHTNLFFAQKMKWGRVVNYEDLYYIVTQLADAVDEYENPAVSDLLRIVTERFLTPPLSSHSSISSEDLLDEARHYIKGIAAHSLWVVQPVRGHLSQVIQAATDPFVVKLEIFTLNHDVLIERTFQNVSIPLSTGFVQVSDDLLCWDRKHFLTSRSKVRLNKLHGSVNWYPVRFSPAGPSRVCVATNNDIEHTHGPDGQPPTILHDAPEMLIGTFNKMLEYSMGIYADLLCAFRAALWNLDKLVISGCSFTDKGVNASIAEWMSEGHGRRTLIIAPHASHYRYTARGAIRRLFDNGEGRIKTIDSTFEAVGWSVIREWSETT